MEDILNESVFSLVEDTLLRLNESRFNLKPYPECQSLDSMLKSSDSDEFKKLFEDFNQSLQISFKQVKKFKGLEIKESFYNLKDCYKFENIIVRNISFDSLLDELFYIKIGSFYHILKINMINFNLNIKTRMKRRIFDKKEVATYFKCDRLRTILSRIMFDILAPEIDLEKLEILLGENMVEEWDAFLEDYSLKYERIIKIKARKIAYTPNILPYLYQ